MASSLSPEELRQALKNKAIYLLARREHSRQELIRKLIQRGFAAQAISSVLDELENEGLLNEQRFITSFIRSRRARGFGPLKICAELKEHGIDRSLWQSNEEWQEELWQNSATILCAKRFGLVAEKTPEERIRQSRYLQQRGFTSQQIKIAVNQNWENQ
jgi:regulatory protein